MEATLFTDSTNSIALFVSVLFISCLWGVALRMVGILFLRQANTPKEIRTVFRRVKKEE